MFAIDQFVLGGRLLLFVDPLCMVDMQNHSSNSNTCRRAFNLATLFTARREF